MRSEPVRRSELEVVKKKNHQASRAIVPKPSPDLEAGAKPDTDDSVQSAP